MARIKFDFFGRSNHKASTAGVAASATSATILSTDDDICSSEGLRWLLKCIFRQDDLLRYAESEFGPILNACKSYSEANNLIYAHLKAKVSWEKPGKVSPLVRRAIEAAHAHEAETQRNRNAYTVGAQKTSESGWWPDPSDPENQRSLFSELPFRKRFKFINRRTAVVSAGSCFASEIAYALQREGLNYIVTEHSSQGQATGDGTERMLSKSSANWGDIFNTPSFRQLLEYSFGLRKLPRIVWQLGDHFLDPFRDGLRFATVSEYEANYDHHISAARAALEQAEVFIITLGLNEVWYFKMDNSVFSRSPWRIAPSFVEHRTLSVAENVAELQRMLDILRAHNHRVKVIVTVSPVPLHATFLHDTYHVVEANMHSKSVLRVAAQEFVEKNNDVYYFPSFELVTYGFENPWADDERHVDSKTVNRIMEMFREMFVVDAS
ncbi:MAG: GSCFA domain-containing protein [Verrucomicrobia bacterium]|nr:GSCFA domain-containing protein [Verrucomicrobiota bacterium]